MTKGVIWCRDSDDISRAANLMQSKQVRRLPVLDKNKRMVGILSLGEACRRIMVDCSPN
jgi:CBS domain-containing protein